MFYTHLNDGIDRIKIIVDISKWFFIITSMETVEIMDNLTGQNIESPKNIEPKNLFYSVWI